MLRIGGVLKIRRVPLPSRTLAFSTIPNSTLGTEKSQGIPADRPTINAINQDLFKTFKNILMTMHNDNHPQLGKSSNSKQPRPLTIYDRQIEIEEKQHSAAVNGQAEMITSLRQLGKGTSVKRVQRSLVKWYEPLTAALAEEIELVENSVPGGDRTVSLHNRMFYEDN